MNRRLGGRGCTEYLAGRSSRVTSLEMRKLIRTRHKFYHSLDPLLPFLIFPSSSWRWFLSPSFSWGLFGRLLLNLRPINQTIPYKFVTREIARILGAEVRLFSLPPIRTPGYPGETSLCARFQPLLCFRRAFTAVSARIFTSRVNNYRVHKTWYTAADTNLYIVVRDRCILSQPVGPRHLANL